MGNDELTRIKDDKCSKIERDMIFRSQYDHLRNYLIRNIRERSLSEHQVCFNKTIESSDYMGDTESKSYSNCGYITSVTNDGMITIYCNSTLKENDLSVGHEADFEIMINVEDFVELVSVFV